MRRVVYKDVVKDMTILVEAASDELIVEQVARAIYCAVDPDMASIWNVECTETRLHYFDLASAAIRALAGAIEKA